MKKLLVVGSLVVLAYAAREHFRHEAEERSIWAEVASSFGEYPPTERRSEVHITRVG